MTPKIKDVAEFILKNRRNWAFKDMTENQIVQDILTCSKQNGVAYILEDNNITGIILCTPDKNTKTLFIHNILCITKKAMLEMCYIFNEKYPDYLIQEIRFKTKELKTYVFTKRYIRLLIRLNSKES